MTEKDIKDMMSLTKMEKNGNDSIRMRGMRIQDRRIKIHGTA